MALTKVGVVYSVRHHGFAPCETNVRPNDFPPGLSAAAGMDGEKPRLFDSGHGPLAQLAEQQTLNLRVAGSMPARLIERLRRVRRYRSI